MPVIKAEKREGPGSPFRYVWKDIPRASEGEPLSLSGGTDRSIQVFGRFRGATVVIEGSLEDVPVNYAPLTDRQGNEISFLGAGMAIIAGVTYHTRWRVLGGSAETNLTVIIMSRSA